MIYDITIVGAGLTGLSAAMTAQEKGAASVLLLEHQASVGGFTLPYQAAVEFANEKRAVERASKQIYPVWLRSTVIGFMSNAGDTHTLLVQTPHGMEKVESRKILFASGSMEKPKEALNIPGGRPSGVMTPYMAAELLHKGYRLGENVVLFEHGRMARSAAMLLERSSHRVHVLDQEELLFVQGTSKLEGIRVKNKTDGAVRDVPCDTLLYSNGRYASTFYMKGTSIERDVNMAIVADMKGRTAIKGLYAAGTCTVRGDDDHGNSIEQGEAVMLEMLA